MSNEIWVVIEKARHADNIAAISRELLGKGRALADANSAPLAAVVLGSSVGALAERAFGCLADHGEGFDQQIVEGLALGQALAELDGLGAQGVVGELLERRLQRIDLRHRLVEAFDDPVIGRPEQVSGERAEHENLDIVKT